MRIDHIDILVLASLRIDDIEFPLLCLVQYRRQSQLESIRILHLAVKNLCSQGDGCSCSWLKMPLSSAYYQGLATELRHGAPTLIRQSTEILRILSIPACHRVH